MQLYGIVLELVGVGFPNPSDAGLSPFAGGETPPLRLNVGTAPFGGGETPPLRLNVGTVPFAGGETPPLRLELKGEYHGQKLLRQSIWDIETER
jgi:hypothetical protein